MEATVTSSVTNSFTFGEKVTFEVDGGTQLK